MPAVVTCVVAKRLGRRLSDNHWELRDFAANLVASICRRSRASVYVAKASALHDFLLPAYLSFWISPSNCMIQGKCFVCEAHHSPVS